MLKKVIGGTLFAGLIGVLVFGAVNRTLAKTGNAAETRGEGYGRGRSTEALYASDDPSQDGARLNSAERDRDQASRPEWAGAGRNSQGSDRTDQTGSSPAQLGAGRSGQGTNGTDQTGSSPAQLGAGRNGQGSNGTDQTGSSPAQLGAGRNGQGSNSTDQTGSSPAQLGMWLQLYGSVVSVDADALVIQMADGEQIAVENRPWSFAQEQGFSAQLNDELTLTGFYEGEEFEVGRIDDATNGQTVLLRDESGRPMWAGRGRRGS